MAVAIVWAVFDDSPLNYDDSRHSTADHMVALTSIVKCYRRMNIAILHYHLNRGGVTQVVLNHLRSLDEALEAPDRVRVALFYGGRREGISDDQLQGFRSLEVTLHETIGLEYDGGGAPSSNELYFELQQTLATIEFAPENTVLHIHNHSLGKNASLPAAQRQLASDGYPLLLQIHDFAEDFRPGNYVDLERSSPTASADWPSIVYPAATQIHYASLNRRDFKILAEAGVGKSNLHLLPNPVGDFGTLPDKDATRQKLSHLFNVDRESTYILYPVRGIRRKNLGEALLWSILAEGRATVGLTLPPLNPIERGSYDTWKAFANELNLTCRFETGARHGMSFVENLSAADLILTTSVAEGFGMVFLESWLAGRRLIGRDLPEITVDFADAGLCLKELSPRLAVPIEWIGRGAFFARFHELYQSVRTKFGRPRVEDSWLDSQIECLIENETVDFGHLASDHQRRVLRTATESADRRAELLDGNAWAVDALQFPAAGDQLIEQNAEAVRSGYSLNASGNRLWALYRQILAGPRENTIGSLPAPSKILDSFLAPARLHPLRLVS